jgi:RNA polymerase sigma-70 factor (ECF subfamily)
MRRRRSWPRLAFSRERPAAAGHENAGQENTDRFNQLIMPHLDNAYRYARFLSRDGSVAEDVVQDAFVKALKAMDQCRGDPRAWLFTIVRNCHHDWARTNARYHAIAASSDLEAGALASTDTLQQREEIAHVRQTIESLPEPFREALVLRELEELSYRDIAEVTGAPIGTVMSRLARARQMLAVLLLDGDSPVRKDEPA